MAVAGAAVSSGGLGGAGDGAVTFGEKVPDGGGTESRRLASNDCGEDVGGANTGVGADATARGAGGMEVSAAGAGGWGRTVAWSRARASRAGGRKAVGHNSRTWSSRDARTA